MWNLDWSSLKFLSVKGAAELNLEDLGGWTEGQRYKAGHPKFGTVFTQTGATDAENT